MKKNKKMAKATDAISSLTDKRMQQAVQDDKNLLVAE